jgi:hypothetical protein
MSTANNDLVLAALETAHEVSKHDGAGRVTAHLAIVLTTAICYALVNIAEAIREAK